MRKLEFDAAKLNFHFALFLRLKIFLGRTEKFSLFKSSSIRLCAYLADDFPCELKNSSQHANASTVGEICAISPPHPDLHNLSLSFSLPSPEHLYEFSIHFSISIRTKQSDIAFHKTKTKTPRSMFDKRLPSFNMWMEKRHKY